MKRNKDRTTAIMVRQLQQYDDNKRGPDGDGDGHVDKRGKVDVSASSGGSRWSRDVRDREDSPFERVRIQDPSSSSYETNVSGGQDVTQCTVLECPPSGIHSDEYGEVMMSCDDHMVQCYDGVVCQDRGYVCALENIMVVDVYSPPGVGAHAHKYGLSAGHAIYIKCRDENGEPGDLSKAHVRNKLACLIWKANHLLLMGLPRAPCFLL